MRRIGVLLCAAVLLLSVGLQSAWATGTNKDQSVTPQAFMYLKQTSCSHDKAGDKVFVWGTTTTYQPVNKLTTTVYLEKQVSNSWLTVNQWSSVEYNADYSSVAKSTTVERGFYYRVRAYHRADHGSVTETNMTSTGIFYVQ